MLKIQKTYQKPIATLFLVATPIGNLKDFSQRGQLILREEVDVIFCEQKTTSQKLLNHWKISKKIYVLHKFNEKTQTKKILSYLQKNQNVALISCAGTPLIADPGYNSVKEALEAGFYVTAIGIQSAFLHAAICSGLPVNQFLFSNFLEIKLAQRTKQLNSLLNSPNTFVCYEAIHRLAKTINLLKKLVPNRKFCLAKELTKIYETFYRGTFAEFSFDNFPLRGEFVLVIEGNQTAPLNREVDAFLNKVKKFTLTPKQVVSLGTELGYKRKILYEKLTQIVQKDKIKVNKSLKKVLKT